MADEELAGTAVVRQFLGGRQGLTDQKGQALPQRIVEPFDVIGFPRFLADGFAALRRNHAVVYNILVCVKCSC